MQFYCLINVKKLYLCATKIQLSSDKYSIILYVYLKKIPIPLLFLLPHRRYKCVTKCHLDGEGRNISNECCS